MDIDAVGASGVERSPGDSTIQASQDVQAAKEHDLRIDWVNSQNHSIPALITAVFGHAVEFLECEALIRRLEDAEICPQAVIVSIGDRRVETLRLGRSYCKLD